ncbi:aminotransferase-like domain-containing protein [Amycolatopsis sp. CA-230715]|uniref:aminotransferase-like domain-containing protein n=1 Tax=Amycolatopsis sp. CA-230715 TaxID=2745196 RepID=UPI001C00C23C|nr:PLP-dependent aminotransferase family protein [Amycolatopsis sp. CA-230715]QWF84117.1 2-aminoadipate transaminase [Amycolatopsis sp. CA-230715]
MNPDVVQFSRGVPPIEAIPARELAEHTEAAVAELGPRLFQYPPIGRYLGDPTLREQLAKRHDADPDHILVTNGSLQALDLLAAHLLSGSGAAVYVEGPTYDRAARIFERHGGRVSSIPLEADGMDLADLRERLRAEVPAFVYTVPDFQNPSGVTLSLAKRGELLGLAAEYGFTVIEDIPYRDLRFHGETLPSLSELAEGARVITLGSLSKVLSPGLRIGYVISDADTALELATRSEGVYLSPVGLCQAVAARALGSGLVTENVERARDFLRPRHDAAVRSVQSSLGDALMAVPDGGYYVGVRVKTGSDPDAFLDRALGAGVKLISGSAFYPSTEKSTVDTMFLRLPFQAMTPEEFSTGVERLAASLS